MPLHAAISGLEFIPHPPARPPARAACRAQEELEEKLEKYSVRRVPLGADRHHRRYWWGLAGQRPVVWVEDAEVSGRPQLGCLRAQAFRRHGSLQLPDWPAALTSCWELGCPPPAHLMPRG